MEFFEKNNKKHKQTLARQVSNRRQTRNYQSGAGKVTTHPMISQITVNVNRMPKEDKLFLLRAKLTNTVGCQVESCSFERLVGVRFLYET